MSQEPTPTDPREQATKCGKCGEHKHTPWRDNQYGYVCLKCLAEGFATNSKLAADLDLEKKRAQRLWETGEALTKEKNQLAAEIAELKSTVQQCCESINHHIELEATLRAELEAQKQWRNEAEGKLIECGREIANHVAELETARKERDEAKEEFRKAAEWNRLTELELTNLRRLNADLDEDLAALRAEVEAFTKHVGGPTFKDSVDVLLRTKSQDEDKIAEMFGIIKRTGAERDTALAAKDTAERERDRMRDVKWEGILAIEQQRDAAEKIVTEAQSFLTAALTEQITHAEHWVNHYSADPLGKSDRAHWDGKARAFTACLDLITSALTPAPTQDPPAGVSPWQPIETAPTDGKIQIMIAEFRDGELIDIDFDAILEQESESWEIPQTYWIWKSAHGRVENPTHWQPIIPPAGGVTISNETVGIIPTATTLTEASPDVSTLGAEAASHPISTEKKGGDEPCHKTNALAEDAQCSPEVTHTTALVASNSPADVRSVGRGECVHGIKMTQVCEKCSRFLHFHHGGRGELLPFNLSDALAGKPVVTRDGSWRGTLVAAPNLDADIIGDYVAIAVMTAGPFLVLRDGRLFNDRLNDKDLFMLPTEGSGA